MREKPKHLDIYEVLDRLDALTQENRSYMLNLKKGYEGERAVDSQFEKLSCPHVYLPDRLLQTNRQTFQLDSVLITGKGVYVYEIKNYKGEYIFEENRIKHFRTRKTLLKPSTQLEKSETLFKMFLEEYRINLPIYAYVLFIHPEFTFYQMPPDQNILLPSMLNSHLKELNKISTPLYAVHKRLAQKINDRHISASPYADIPKYTFDELKKGANCLKCQSFNLEVLRKVTTCMNCDFKELNTEVILRKSREFKLLFPNERLTTRNTFEWCGEQYSKKSIQLVLQKNFKEVGARKGKYYI